MFIPHHGPQTETSNLSVQGVHELHAMKASKYMYNVL